MTAATRTLGCCGGSVAGDLAEHLPACPSTVRAALTWIEETPNGERHRKRGLAALDAILAERDQLRAELAEAERVIALCAADATAADLAQDIEFMKAEHAQEIERLKRGQT